MNAILGFTDLLNKNITDKKLRNYLEAIKAGGKNLLTLINDILDLSKIEAGKLELQYEPVNLYEFMREVKSMFQQRAAEKQLELRASIDKSLPESLLIDEVRLRQILFNLVGNAVKFTESGYIEITLDKVVNEDDRSKLDLIFSVSDTGIGIPEESQDEIFESFKQQEGQSTKKFGGTGLGLAITKRLVEMMEGSISVKSEPGKGSTFTVCLTDVSAAAVEKKSRMDTDFDSDRIRFKPAVVLIADDIKMNRDLISEFFADSNLTTITAENGSEAVSFVKQQDIDVVLMDIRMPVMDGWDAMKAIRALPDKKNTPIIAITASAMKEQQKQILAGGFDECLVKPLHLDELFSVLSKYLKYDKVEGEESAQGEIKTGDDLSLDHIEDKGDLFSRIEKDIIPLHDKATTNHFIQDVLTFAEQLQTLAEDYSLGFLSKYADDLLFYANNFDIENMGKFLNRFNKIYMDMKSA